MTFWKNKNIHWSKKVYRNPEFDRWTAQSTVVALGVDLLHNVAMKIEKNIPLPGGVDPRERYPFPEMAIGDSFMILDATWIKNLRSAAYMYSRRHPGTRFTCRRHGEGWRLWRVS